MDRDRRERDITLVESFGPARAQAPGRGDPRPAYEVPSLALDHLASTATDRVQRHVISNNAGDTLSLYKDACHFKEDVMNSINVVLGPPGCGKSTYLLMRAIACKGRYLFACPTINLIDEQFKYLRAAAPNIPVRPVHSRNGQKGKVIRQLDALPNDFALFDHVVAFVTHETLMDADLSKFAGWHLFIDEAPQAVNCGKLNLATGWEAFEQMYTLEAVPGAEWSRVCAKKSSPSWKDVKQDSLWRTHGDFIKQVARPHGVHIRATKWGEGRDRDLEWFSMWSPLALGSFETISVAGAGYLNSIGYKALKAIHPTLVHATHDLGAHRSAQPSITIRYFTKSHKGSTAYWNNSEGRWCLVQVQNWLSANVPSLGFWSGNEVVRDSFEHRMPGVMALPKVAGLNLYREATSCALIYSSKALPEDQTLQQVFDLSAYEIYSAREGEDLIQFVMRGAIRNADFGGQYDIYLYSLDQAEHLRDALFDCGFTNVELTAVPEAGIMDVARPGASRVAALTPSEAAARIERRRANSRRSSAKLRAKKANKPKPPKAQGNTRSAVEARVQ